MKFVFCFILLRDDRIYKRYYLVLLRDRRSIPGAGNNNVLVTRSDWPTLVSSVCYVCLVSASADLDLKPGSKCCGLQYSSTQQGDYITRGYISLPRWRHIYTVTVSQLLVIITYIVDT